MYHSQKGYQYKLFNNKNILKYIQWIIFYSYFFLFWILFFYRMYYLKFWNLDENTKSKIFIRGERDIISELNLKKLIYEG